ncbi:hypothetical protein KKA14_07215, partial [bacterium]|nr:hypothetical protein [bacterium]
MVDESVLKYVVESQKDLLIDQLLNFHYQLENWINGFWHEQITANRFLAFHDIKKSLKFESNWSCATFLSGCGYLFPFSKIAFNAWLKWSGEKSVDEGYERWLKLLEKVDTDHQRLYYTDRLFDLVFSKDSPLTDSAFCLNISFCYSCPLNKKCQYFSTRLQEKRISILENLMREDRLEEAATDELIVFLNKRHWQGTEKQIESIQKYPNLSFSMLTEPSINSDDEELIFCLLVLQELMNRTTNAEPVQSETIFSNSREIYNAFKHELCRKQQESFNTLILDNKHRKIDFRLITKGTLNQSLVHP